MNEATSRQAVIENEARAIVDHVPHYIDSLSEMAGSLDMTTMRDIVSVTGAKVLPGGVRVDERLHEKLSGHRISGRELENGLAIAGGVDPESLARDIARLIDGHLWLSRLANLSGDALAMRHGVARLVLPSALRFRLTVARERRAPLYRHTLAVTAIAHYLALRLGLKPGATDAVLVGALCHDLGELFTDPAILDPIHRVSESECRYIYVHPITGWLIVRDLPGLDPEVPRAVIQHQERLDGSGYPYGIKGEAIGTAGRILAVADVAASIMARCADEQRLATLLRLNASRYDKAVLAALHDSLRPGEAAAPELDAGTLAARLGGFARLVDGWARLRADERMAGSAPVSFLSERMYALRTVVVGAGFDPDSLEQTMTLVREDAGIARELAAVVDELDFRLRDLEREIDRHRGEWAGKLDAEGAAAFEAWRRSLHETIG